MASNIHQSLPPRPTRVKGQTDIARHVIQRTATLNSCVNRRPKTWRATSARRLLAASSNACETSNIELHGIL